MKSIRVSTLRSLIKEYVKEAMDELDEASKDLDEDEFSYAAAKAAHNDEDKFTVGKGKDKQEFPVTMSKKKAKKILGKQQG